MTDYLPNGRPAPKKKKKQTPAPGTAGRGGVAQYKAPVPPQNVDKLYSQRLATKAYPFKSKSGPKYASETKRLVDSLGIQVKGIEKHPDPDAVYTSIGNALHRLPSAAWPWLDKHGSKLKFIVTKDGLIKYDNSGTSDPSRVSGMFDGNIKVGVPREKSAYSNHSFTTPNGKKVSPKYFTSQAITDVTTHEFGHWLDKQSGGLSKKHEELFGSVKNFNAPHDKRQWEQFANGFSAYLGSADQRKTLSPSVIKFMDKYIAPTLSTDSDPNRKTSRNKALYTALRRVTALRLMNQRRQLLMHMPVIEFEKVLDETERELDQTMRQGGK